MHRRLLSALIAVLSVFVIVEPATVQTGYAGSARAGRATSLDSLPFTHAKAVTVLTPSKPGSYQGYSIDHGLQFTSATTSAPDSALEFHLGGHYASLSGTAYTDSSSRFSPQITILDISSPVTGVKLLLQTVVNGQATFNLDLRGVQDISIGVQGAPGSYGPAVADIVANVGGAAPRTLTILVPATNAVLSRSTPVGFQWKSFPAASAYIVAMQLIRASTTTTLTAASELSFTKLVIGNTYAWDATGFVPGSYQCTVLPVNKYGNAVSSAPAVLSFALSN